MTDTKEENLEPTYENLCKWSNIWTAWKKAAKGKRGKGAAAEFEYKLEDNLLLLQSELLEKNYQPGEYSSFYIHEPKRRLISAAPFRDRVVHHALCRIIEPLFERSFIYDSYANRRKKGTHKALNQAGKFSGKYKYFLQCDVQQFFPAIDYAILRRILKKKIKDPEILWLIDCILASGQEVHSKTYQVRYFPGDDLLAALRPRGLPIGNLTSQFWANCYMNPFDHFVKRELGCKAYLRYVDDCLFFENDKNILWKWKKAIIKRMQFFRLTIHEQAAQVKPVTEGIPFLGFITFPTHRRLKRRKGVYYCRRLKKMLSDYHSGDIPFSSLDSSVQGWINHVSFGDTWGLRKSIFNSFTIKPPERAYERENGNFYPDF